MRLFHFVKLKSIKGLCEAFFHWFAGGLIFISSSSGNWHSHDVAKFPTIQQKWGKEIFLKKRNYWHIFSAHQAATEAFSSFQTRGQTVDCWSTLLVVIWPGPKVQKSDNSVWFLTDNYRQLQYVFCLFEGTESDVVPSMAGWHWLVDSREGRTALLISLVFILSILSWWQVAKVCWQFDPSNILEPSNTKSSSRSNHDFLSKFVLHSQYLLTHSWTEDHFHPEKVQPAVSP